MNKQASYKASIVQSLMLFATLLRVRNDVKSHNNQGKGFTIMKMFILSAVLFFVAGAAQAATLNAVGGQLMGASGVDVGVSLYDVQFLDGTCISLYNGCDQVSDFTFQTSQDSVLASQALEAQVFQSGTFDEFPDLTNGCGASVTGSCLVFTPHGLVAIPMGGDTSLCQLLPK